MVIYEWDVETVSAIDSIDYEEDEVIDHRHCLSYKECIEFIKNNPAPVDCKYLIVLVRDDDNGRSWAYVESNALPVYCSDAYGEDCGKIPRRYHAELARA